MDNTQLYVLVLDDDPDDARILQRHLNKIDEWAIQFQHCEQLEETLASIARRSPDLLFVDYLLGGETGLQAVTEIRNKGFTGPIVFLTGEGDEHVAAKAFKSGADDYLTKDVVSARSLRQAICNVQEAGRLKNATSERNRELEQEKLVSVQRTDGVFSSYHTLSQELKNPLTSASTYLGLVLDGQPGALNEEQAGHLKIVKQSHDQMLRLINDLLDATRLQTGNMSIKQDQTSMAALTKKALGSVSGFAKRKGIRLALAAGPHLPDVSIDASRIRQVMTNLLTNAIKFTPKGGKVEVTLRRSSEDWGWLEVQVKDTGNGIRLEDIDRIFDQFYQVDSGESQSQGGLGVGLSIARQLVELHGGKLTVLSSRGNGSTFTFSLPAVEVELQLPPTSPVKASGKPAANAKKILVVDSDELVRTGLALQLESAGYAVATAFDSATGVMAASKQHPDLLLLDVSSQTCSGFMVAEQIKSFSSMANVPIIFLTAQDDPALVERAEELGAYAYLSKPCASKQLLSNVRGALGQSD